MLLINAVNAAGRPVELFVKDGKIAAMGQDLSALAGEGETVLDAGGLTVLPAFVDLHCHWRTPGFEYKEDIATGSMAAAAGGYTFVNLMPNTKPICSSAAQAAMVEQKAAEVGLCDVNQTVSITENFDGKTIDHLKTLPASVKFITEDGHGVQDNATMARAFAICTQRDITVMSHAEDMEISPWDYRLAEDLETVRNCWLSEYYQTRLHMCHVSTRGALEAIQMAKLRGAPVTCEVTPHHLWFNNETCDYRVNPPIRTADDVQALIDGIRSGVVDAIATDHAPHSEEDKLKGMAGMVGSETAFGVCYTKLCREEGLPLELLVHLMSTRPAEILGLAKGQLEPGYDADFVLVDLDTMARAFAICTQRDITVMSHAEDMEISPWDYRLAEDLETVRNCWLSEYYQTRLHMCHVSTRGALEAIQMAKLRGAPVTCEVTPHHLWFNNETCDYRVNPPIRTADDVQALIDGIRSGVVDAIATDHAPHSEEDKLKGMAGMVGSETAFGVCYTKLCREEGLPLELLVHLMSTRPAEILGLAKGQLEPGYDADFVLVDLDTPYTVDKEKLHSKSHNCPFDGAQLYGRVYATIKGGKLTYQAEE